MEKLTKNIIILSTADWDNPFWTNKQHVALDLAKKGYNIFYIDSLGLRKPGLNKKDFKRIFNRLVKGIRPPKKVHHNIKVWSPVLIPFNDNSIIRKINNILFNSLLKLWSNDKKSNTTLWTYNPLTTQFLDLTDFSYVVYHCVDEIKAQPGMPIDILEQKEEELTRNADIVFVTSPTLLESRRVWSNNVHYFSNVADYDHFSKALEQSTIIPEDLREIEGPILGFIGAISSYKINFLLLEKIAKSHPEWNIVLIGDVGEGDPNTNVDILRKLRNIHFLGAKDYSSLPSYLKGFDVALLPNNINSYTDNMFPMKFFEYLAAGRNVVSVNLPSIKEFSEYFKLTHNDNDFIQAIESILQGDSVELDKIQLLAKQFTYDTRTRKMINLINQPELIK